MKRVNVDCTYFWPQFVKPYVCVWPRTWAENVCAQPANQRTIHFNEVCINVLLKIFRWWSSKLTKTPGNAGNYVASCQENIKGELMLQIKLTMRGLSSIKEIWWCIRRNIGDWWLDQNIVDCGRGSKPQHHRESNVEERVWECQRRPRWNDLLLTMPIWY